MKKKIGFFLLLGIIVFCFFLGGIFLWLQKDKELPGMEEKAAYAVSWGEKKGNGLLWDAQEGEAVFVLPAHVMEITGSQVAQDTPQSPEITINGTIYPVLAWEISALYDVGFVKISLSEDQGWPLFQQEDGIQEINSGDTFWLYGALDGETLSLQGTMQDPWIYVEDFGYHMMWGLLDGVVGGLSGSGIYDSQGRFLGILCGGDRQGEVVILPVSLIRAQWKNTSLTY